MSQEDYTSGYQYFAKNQNKQTKITTTKKTQQKHPPNSHGSYSLIDSHIVGCLCDFFW